MFEVKIKVIPGHIAYHAEFDVEDYNDFFDKTTGVNSLQQLADQVERENTNLQIPPIPGDYNYFTHPAGQPVSFPAHIGYYDMVTDFGRNTEQYVFVGVPETIAVVVAYKGPYREIGKAYDFAYRWIQENGYQVAGEGRSSAIHGPWDREDEAEYLTEVQIPVSRVPNEEVTI